MKKFAVILTLFQLLILPMFKSEALASEPTLSIGATADLNNEIKHPVLGQIGLEKSFVRLTAALGTEGAVQGNVDLIARRRGGLYGGVGLFVERLGTELSSTSTDTATTTIAAPHDHGKHLGDKHVRGGKLVTTTSSSAHTLRIGNEDLGLSPAITVGGAARNGLFGEGHVIFGGEYGVRGQAVVGIRF